MFMWFKTDFLTSDPEVVGTGLGSLELQSRYGVARKIEWYGSNARIRLDPQRFPLKFVPDEKIRTMDVYVKLS